MANNARRSRSLTFRVLFLASLWAAVALVVIAVVISTLYRQSAEKSFRDLLRAQLYNVINSISTSENTRLAGTPQLGDLRFFQPQSGWYWIVEPIGGALEGEALTSSSLGTGSIPIPDTDSIPFDTRYERFYTTIDSFGNEVEVGETEVVLDDEGRTARFRVVGNRDVLESDISDFSGSLYLALAGFGVGSLLLNAAAILIGLRPLDRARKALEKIRAGESEQLDGDFPREILPLASEVNALIDSNHRIVERARMQVGNLAHSLKTPIAVLLNESRLIAAPQGELVKTQAEAMQGQVQSYLNRARIAAQRESVLARTEALPVLERLVRVMRRLNADKQFPLHVDPPGIMLAMEQQDIEETVGNLLENAARYARTTVSLRVFMAPADLRGSDDARKSWVIVEVEDDGPGLEPDEIREAMKRGKRLDESKPGTGLGLSIVSEIASEYQGVFGLSRGEGGGLLARLVLPAVTKDVA
ncbi:histidine kinase [Shinella sp. AETb1-6]|jgi:signal transduction histidine kinase|uniref:histidine kinase n=2 Tax=Shinella TaxID=323620 RepID=A0ABY9K1V2_9HYPH|nr:MULTISPECIES: HAMP domain-containing sensor histidine kinase [Shinella]MXN51394.1 histidine kinase [Shinella sp. AETb1-6]WLS01634.1 HAMP domain-containing sensor histidine kinase [Shinella oryzae]WLS09210.1 HAMP domain-containing sensor histidine kinase [Shinella sumterensis]